METAITSMRPKSLLCICLVLLTGAAACRKSQPPVARPLPPPPPPPVTETRPPNRPRRCASRCRRSMPMSDAAGPAPDAARRAHPRHRRRHGHDDPGATRWTRRTSAASEFADHARDLKGNNDLLRPDAAGHRRGHPPAVPRGRRRHHRDQHLQRHRDLPGRLRPARTSPTS